MVLKFDTHDSRSDPFNEINCPVCLDDHFTSMDHSSVWCDTCNAEFQVRGTSGDPGYVVDCRTEWVWKDSAKYPELIGESPYCIVKNDEPPRWIVSSKRLLPADVQWPLPIQIFLSKYTKMQYVKAEKDSAPS